MYCGRKYCGYKVKCSRLLSGQKHDLLQGKECTASAAFTFELATRLAGQIERGVAQRMDRARPHRQHTHVPYKDVRTVLLEAFKAADKIKEAHPASLSYEENWTKGISCSFFLKLQLII